MFPLKSNTPSGISCESLPDQPMRVLMRQHIEALHQEKPFAVRDEMHQEKIEEQVAALFL